jgi:hypothetical protein
MTKYKLYQYCKVQNKVVPIEQVQREYQSNARDLFIQDEMPPTRNPLNPSQIFTSKSKLRAVYKAAGAVEVGDAYDRGYDPMKHKASTDKVAKSVINQIRERMNYGR